MFDMDNWQRRVNGSKPSSNGFDADKEESTDEETDNWRANFGASSSVINGLDKVREHFEQLRSAPDPIVNALMPVLKNSQSELTYGVNHLTKNMENICSNLNSVFFNDPVWSHELVPQIFNGAQDQVIQMAHKLRNVAKKVEASYTWSGQLPRRVRTKNPIYSCKVFLGGIPYDLTDSDLHCTFAHFGNIQIQWPGKDIKSAIDGAAANKAGYVYIIFESYDNVANLLNACTISYRDVDTGCRWYYNISSRRQKGKEVQVIPFDIGDRFYMKGSFSGQMEHSRTVFVGALHGMLTADGLAKVMDDLFGGVIFAGLDTDKHKYPLGSGRVTFDNQDSYLKAVSAAFVEIKSARFKKKIQIDPYIENESLCAVCKLPQQSPIFCRDLTCFRYFCRSCWDTHHSEAESINHRPIIKNKPPN